MKILIASHNHGKIAEFKRILEPFGYEVLSASDLGISMDDVEETGETFVENAFIKAQAVSKQSNLLTIADDSGLMVHALPEIMGVKTARFMGEDTPYPEKHQKLLAMLEGASDRTAHFDCALALVGEGVSECFEGRVNGSIAQAVEGSAGFGYDPVFIPEGYEHTFSALPATVKASVSHRGRALQSLVTWLEQQQ